MIKALNGLLESWKFILHHFWGLYDNTEKCMTPKDSPMGNSRLFNFILPVQKLQFRIAYFISLFYKFTVVFL